MTDKWILKYWPPDGTSDIERWFKKLTNDQQKTIVKLLAVLKKAGNELKLPHSRSLGKGLFELRDRKYGYRIYYMFYERHIIILLSAGDKSTQQHDIKISRQRLTQVLKHGEDLL